MGRIAAFLNLPVQTVNQRLYRARKSLRGEILAMVKKNLEEYKMSDDFSQNILRQALQEGAEALEAQDWSAAKSNFASATEIEADHPEAHRGLGLASGGEVSAALTADPGFADGDKVRAAFAALQRAHQLNPRDEAVIHRLTRLYSDYGRHREGGELAEKAADNFDQWPQQVGLLAKAVALYYHSHYIGGEDNMESCVRCHRRARALLPADLAPRRRLAIWTPAGMSLAYAHVGQSQEVFDELKGLRALVEDRWAVQEFFQYSGVMTNQYREMEAWDQVEHWSREFVDWARALAVGDPRLDIAPLCLTPEADKSEAGKVGISFCRWSICYALADRIAKARHQAGLDTAPTFAEIDEILALEEERAEPEGEGAHRHLSGFYQLAANAAYETGCYQQAVEYYRREEELAGEICHRGPLYLAAALTALGRIDEAKQRLAGIFGPVVSRGQIRAYFDKCSEFEPIRQDEDVAALVESWQRVEAAGRVE